VVHQFVIALHRSRGYEGLLQEKRQRARTCLGLLPENKFDPSWLEQRGNTTVIKLPHAEFFLAQQPNGAIAVVERPRNMTTIELDGRMLLWSGYHRSHAVLSQINPEGSGSPAIFAALIFPTGESEGFLGRDSLRPEVRDAARGERPPVFSDFFDEALCMTVNLRKQRPEFHVDDHKISTARMVWVDDAT
jgi:hypothetical protein